MVPPDEVAPVDDDVVAALIKWRTYILIRKCTIPEVVANGD